MGPMEGELIEVDGLLAGLAAAGPTLEQWLEEPDGLGEGEAVDGAKVGGGARG